MSYKIAIDGYSSSGKSTVAKMLAKELKYIYIDTGAMYRAVALYLVKNNIDYNDEKAVESAIDKINIDFEYADDDSEKMLVLLNGEDVSGEIRTPLISNAASISSQFKAVREKLQVLQRNIADKHSCIMDGRDIGTKVLPDANLKIFMTASTDCRIKRRLDEYKAKGENFTYEEVKKEIEERDYRDTHRENDPLTKAPDAIEIDNTNMTIDENVDKILELL